MTGVSWRIRPFAAAADRAWVRLLWQAAMPPSWPVLRTASGSSARAWSRKPGMSRWGSQPSIRLEASR